MPIRKFRSIEEMNAADSELRCAEPDAGIRHVEIPTQSILDSSGRPVERGESIDDAFAEMASDLAF